MTLEFGKSYAKPNSAHADLQEDVCKYWRAKSPAWIPVKELDLGSRAIDREVKRADVFAMSETYPPRFLICEVKVSRADFLRGVKEEQHLAYAEDCGLFYFVTAEGIVTLEDIPPFCGWIAKLPSGRLVEYLTGEPNKGFKMNDQLWHSYAKKLDGG